MADGTVESSEIHTVIQVGGKYSYQLASSVLAQGLFNAINALLQDDALEEIVYNGPQQPVRVYHKQYGFCDTNLKPAETAARQWIDYVVKSNKRVISEQAPFFDGSLPDGSRVNITIPPASPDYSTFTIRKFKHVVLTVIDFVRAGLLDSRAAAFLWCAVEGLGYKPANVLIVGGTGSGKTTALNAFSMFIPPAQRIITIEDTPELQLMHTNKVKLISRAESGVTMDSLLKNALRMRPDRIIVGEVRGSEALTLFEAMNVGHAGSMGTLHADSARETINRVTNAPMNVPESMISVLDLIVVLKRITLPSGQKRVVQEITELGANVQFNVLYSYNAKSGKLESTGIPSRLRTAIATAAGLTPGDFDKVVEDRAKLLDDISKQDLSPWYLFNSFESLRYHWKQPEQKHKTLLQGVLGRFL